MKAYETKNTHEARNEAIEFCNEHFAAIIWNAWRTCERIDYTAEWDEMDFATIISALRENGKHELADELEAEAIRAYGDTEATMREDADMYGEDGDWGYGW